MTVCHASENHENKFLKSLATIVTSGAYANVEFKSRIQSKPFIPIFSTKLHYV